MATAAAKTTKSAPSAKAAPQKADASTPSATLQNAAQDQLDKLYEAFNENAETFRAQSEDMMSALRDNAEAASERLQALNQEVAAAAREEMTDAVAFANDLAAAKSLSDAFTIQRDYVSNLFEARMEHMRTFTETAAETIRDGFDSVAPLSDAMTAAYENAPFEKFFPFSSK